MMESDVKIINTVIPGSLGRFWLTGRNRDCARYKGRYDDTSNMHLGLT